MCRLDGRTLCSCLISTLSIRVLSILNVWFDILDHLKSIKGLLWQLPSLTASHRFKSSLFTTVCSLMTTTLCKSLKHSLGHFWLLFPFESPTSFSFCGFLLIHKRTSVCQQRKWLSKSYVCSFYLRLSSQNKRFLLIEMKVERISCQLLWRCLWGKQKSSSVFIFCIYGAQTLWRGQQVKIDQRLSSCPFVTHDISHPNDRYSFSSGSEDELHYSAVPIKNIHFCS